MQHISYKLFVAILLFAPLAFGSVETWSIGLVEALIFLTTIIYCWEIRHKSQVPLKVPGAIPLFLLLLFMWVQLIPLPPSLVSFIAPGIYQAYAPILDLQENNQWIPLTVNQKSTLLEALRITSYAFFYILTVQLLSNSSLLKKTVKIIAGLATIIAFLAILQKFTSPDLIYWFRPVPERTQPFGPWINYNHYAGFMELLFPIVLALFFFYRPHKTTHRTFRHNIVSIFSTPGSNIHFFLGFGAVLILASIFLSLSRGGTISATLALLFFLLLASKKTKNTGLILPTVIIGGVLLAMTWFGWDSLFARFNSSTTETGTLVFGRWQIWQACAPLIKDNLLSGTGFGTFVHAYPQYNIQPDSRTVGHAHNDYIELLTDGGLIGFLLSAFFVFTILKHGFKGLTLRKDTYSIFLIIGSLSAILSILVHSIFDFNMHNGANGLYFFLLCGILISAGNTRIHFRNRPTLLQEAPSYWKLSFLVALPLLLLTLAFQGGIIKATQLHKEASKIYLNPRLSEKLLQKQLTTINNAISLDPLEGLYYSYRGTIFSYLQQNQPAFNNFLHASERDPLEGTYLQRIGLSLPLSSYNQASFLMEEGYKRSQNKEKMIFTLAEWYLQQEKTEQALGILRQGTERYPEVARNLPAFILAADLTREEIALFYPSTTAAWITLGEYFERAGDIEEAEYYRSRSLDFLEVEKHIKPQYFMQLFWFYKKQNRTADAVNILQLGIKWLPSYAPFHVTLANHYKEQKALLQAKQEYEQALILDPGNEKIKFQLQALE
ncbi:lipid A core-O-antigen ligase-like enyme [Desulfocapsa sulfexigens DSM 10523]|uniref:Lipid A core-O-antigen ligase-like enyme n=1 Tax=Desulfocapsa sulfexigens (strain DSM 10523 / SB164P1) TaxID=1167006 RepID=M1PPM9_DESSD|nr:O-antigen ligase family protein [Desulfocapsa sulfexigens]AGF78366.1 lipid A core-O-antigen ligase-like enyme [Desulfocapsa sulfexigens DSM 10523]